MSKISPLLKGVLNINKPIGPTSHDVVANIRRLLRVTSYQLPVTKVGHTGTLDPFASGVLLVAIGNATRLIEYSHTWTKTYQTTFTLGATSDTDDLTGTITLFPNPAQPDSSQIKKSLAKLTGTYKQTPPIYSAKKFAGKKLYEYARTTTDPAETLKMVGDRAKSITIHSIKILNYTYPELSLEINCSTGTYIRSLARDLGEILNTGAHVSKLERTKIGKFDINDAIQLNQLNSENLPHSLKPAATLVEHMPAITLNQANVAKFIQGQKIEWGSDHNETVDIDTTNHQPLTIYDASHHLIGIGHIDPATSLLSPDKVLY